MRRVSSVMREWAAFAESTEFSTLLAAAPVFSAM
jgi:hypothetical protein